MICFCFSGSSVKLSIDHVNSLLRSYRKNDDLQNTRTTFKNLYAAKLEPNTLTWNTLIRAEFEVFLFCFFLLWSLITEPLFQFEQEL
jgi:hypothetical protein